MKIQTYPEIKVVIRQCAQLSAGATKMRWLVPKYVGIIFRGSITIMILDKQIRVAVSWAIEVYITMRT